MNKYPLIGVSIGAVVLLVLGSLTNVVGYQSVQSSNQKVLKDEVNQKDLLFQTIVDMANNKEVQKIILNSQIKREGFFNPGVGFSRFSPQVLTKNSLNRMHLVGLMLSKIMSKSRMHSLLERYQVSNQELQKEINAVIQKDTTLKGEMMQLSNMKCDCENDKSIQWSFPILCTILFPLVIFALALYFGGVTFLGQIIGTIMGSVGGLLNCWWA